MTSPGLKVKFGIIGCSRVAQKGMLPAMQYSKLAEVAMVGSRNPEKAKEVGLRFGVPTWGTYEEVLKNKNIHAVYISLPNTLHEEWSVMALDAGKHVICEKPAAISYASAKRMARAAKDNKKRFLEGLMFRYHPQHSEVKEFIRKGVLGDLVGFYARFGFPMPERGNNLMNKNLGGGSLNYVAPYPIYASRMIFDEEPDSVFCKMEFDSESGVNTKADIIMFYRGGKTALASTIFGSYFQSTYSVLGSKACVRMGRAYAVPKDMGTKIFLDTDDKIKEIAIEPADHFRLMLDDFCQEILKGEKSVANYEEDFLAQARVLEAAARSDAENRIVKISEIE